MAFGSNKLTALWVKRVTKPGRYGDGNGLYLQVAKGGAKSWIFRFKRDGRSHDHGLGPLHAISLAEARERAAQARRFASMAKTPSRSSAPSRPPPVSMPPRR